MADRDIILWRILMSKSKVNQTQVLASLERVDLYQRYTGNTQIVQLSSSEGHDFLQCPNGYEFMQDYR